MVKTTKRSRKFNAKGGPKAHLEKKGASITKKGKLKHNNTKKKSSSDATAAATKLQSVVKEEREREEKRRVDNDFTNVENLGELDLDAFFEKAAAGLEEDGDDDDDGSYDEDDSVDSAEDGAAAGEEEDDDDSYASLGSEEEDIEASEARMKKELEKLSKTDPEFHKYLKENESSLLEFGDDDDDDYDNGDDNMDGEEEDDDYIQDEDAMDEILSDDENKIDDNEVTDESIKKQFERQQRMQENKFLLTPQRLTQVEQSAFELHSIKGLKRIISAFRTACHLSDANRSVEQEVDSDDEEAMRKRKKEFQITSPVVFDRLMSVCLVNCQEEFHYHLLGKKGQDEDDHDEDNSNDDDSSSGDEEGKEETFDENKPINPSKLSKSPHWSKVGPSLESFLKSTIHLLSEAGKDANLLKFVLAALSKYVPYLTAFPKISKKLLKTCTRLWSATLDTSEDYNAVRLQAFLRIRQLAITQPYPLIEDCLKMSYLSYAQRSKFGTASNVASVLPTLTFMGNCIVELYTLDYASAYQHAFIYIRQLALHLRTALMKHTPESMAAVYCWQYIHCLKLWVAVLSASQKKNDSLDESSSKLGGGAGKDEEANLLRSLVYPLTEIILGVCRLVPITRYVPLRLHCVRLLQQLAASTESFIPTTSLLLGILDLKEISMKPLRQGGAKKKKKKDDVRGLRLPLILKLPKEGTLRTMEQLDAVLKETFVLLNREVDLYRYSPGFPEFTFTILQRLRKFNKDVSNGRWRAYAKGTIELCEKYSKFVIQGRSTLVEAPKDVRRLEALKPANTPSMGERYDAFVAKEKRLEAATQPVMKAKPKSTPDASASQGSKKKSGNKRKNEDVDEDSDSDEEDQRQKKSKPKSKKRVTVVNEADLKNVEALKEEDEVQEGVVWSDSDLDSD
jgi:nucleolar complex protein 2